MYLLSLFIIEIYIVKVVLLQVPLYLTLSNHMDFLVTIQDPATTYIERA